MFWLLLIAIFLVLLVLVYCSVPWAERKALFFPSRKRIWEPEISYGNVFINVKHPTKVYNQEPESCKHKSYINGWYFNNFPNHKTVLFCHGNSGNISHRSYIVEICQRFKLNLFVYDYRGFGKSSGIPSKRNLRKDGEAAYKFLTDYQNLDPTEIIIWGESLGGIAAIWTASQFPCNALILLCTFSGLDDAITYTFNPGVKQSLAAGYSTLASMRYDIMPNRKYIYEVKCPVAIMHSKKDDVIPYECAKILYKNISHQKKILITIDGKHSSPIITKADLHKLFTFCQIEYEDGEDIDRMLKDLETVAEKHHNFID